MKNRSFKYKYFQDANNEEYIFCEESYNKINNYYIIDHNQEMFSIPPVSHIILDKKENLLFITDDVKVFDDYTCHISFFMDLKGNVVGQGICDYDGRLFDVVLHEFDEITPFIGYAGLKMRLKVDIAEELYQNNGNLVIGQNRLLKSLQNK